MKPTEKKTRNALKELSERLTKVAVLLDDCGEREATRDVMKAVAILNKIGGVRVFKISDEAVETLLAEASVAVFESRKIAEG